MPVKVNAFVMLTSTTTLLFRQVMRFSRSLRNNAPFRFNDEKLSSKLLLIITQLCPINKTSFRICVRVYVFPTPCPDYM